MNQQNGYILERMSDFFTARLDYYEQHMLEGRGKETYQKFAELVPTNTAKILDLGCGTGLELDEIFKRLPNVSVVGIDLTQSMLDILKQKFINKNISLICNNYFKVDLGENIFDSAISFQTMHHFSHKEKIALYTKIRKALKSNGVYIEGDYMVSEQSIEDEFYAENTRIRCQMNIPEGEPYHFDTPCTINNQMEMLKLAGFTSADLMYQINNTAIIISKK